MHLPSVDSALAGSILYAPLVLVMAMLVCNGLSELRSNNERKRERKEKKKREKEKKKKREGKGKAQTLHQYRREILVNKRLGTHLCPPHSRPKSLQYRPSHT